MPLAKLTRAAAALACCLTLALVLVAVLAHVVPPGTPATLAAQARQLAPRDQEDPDIVYLPDRRQYLLVWSEDRGAGHRLYARRLHGNGIAIGSPDSGEWEATRSGADANGAFGDQRWPALIEDLIVYSERRPGAADYDLYAQKLFGNGRPRATPILIADGPGDQIHADVLAVDRGEAGNEYFIVWSEDTRDAGDVMGKRVDYALWRSRGPAFPIARGPGTAEDPTIARDPVKGDQFVVLFTDDRDGARNIYGTRLVQSGLPRGGPTAGHFPVVQSPEDDTAPVMLSSTVVQGQRVDERNLLIWTRHHLTQGPDVMALRLQGNGFPKGAVFSVAAGRGRQAAPAAALRPSGSGSGASRYDEWLVAWTDDTLGTRDVLGVPLGIDGQLRSRIRILASD